MTSLRRFGRSDVLSCLSRGPLVAMNINDQYDAEAVISAFSIAQTPGVLMVTPSACRHTPLALLVEIVRFYARARHVPLFLQLDHCSDLDLIESAAQLNVDIIMADFSAEPAEVNIEKTRAVVDALESSDSLVEGEVEHIGENDLDLPLSSGEVTKQFVLNTGVDLVAPALGTIHGFNRVKPALSAETIRTICREVSVPVVAHGCDFLAPVDCRKLREGGVGKVNFGPELRVAYCVGLRHSISAVNEAYDHRDVGRACGQHVLGAASSIIERMRVGATI